MCRLSKGSDFGEACVCAMDPARQALLVPTSSVADTMEYTAYSCASRRLLKEYRGVFPEMPGDAQELVVIVTFQRTRVDLVSVGPDAEGKADTHARVCVCCKY